MIEIAEYLSPLKEVMPDWLLGYQKGEKPTFKKLLNNRVVFYPGAGLDGQPVSTFNKAHYSHVYFYVDYGLKKETIVNELTRAESFRGYKLIGLEEYSEKEISPSGWVRHYTPTNEEIERMRSYARINPFCFLAIYEREDGYDESHGMKRFAIIYLCADAIAAYDAMFINSGKAPSLIVLQDHGFGGNYNCFGNKGALYQIATSSGVLPALALIADNTDTWDQYDKVKGVSHVLGGAHFRWLYKRF